MIIYSDPTDKDREAQHHLGRIKALETALRTATGARRVDCLTKLTHHEQALDRRAAVLANARVARLAA